MQAADARPITLQWTPPPGSTASVPTLLIVDDEAPIREMVARTAARAGWAVLEAASAEDALDLLPHGHVDLVCLDVRLPVRDGLAVADIIHARYPGIAVLFLTGVDDLPAEKTLRPGVAGYLTKPFILQELLDILLTFTPRRGGDDPPPQPRLRRVK